MERRFSLCQSPKPAPAKKIWSVNALLHWEKKHYLSQRDLSNKLQLAGYDMDKNVITRIETNKRYVTDIEIRALAHIFGVSCDYLIEGDKSENE